MKDHYKTYSEYLMRLMRVEDAFGFKASLQLPSLDELYCTKGNAILNEQTEGYVNERVSDVIKKRNELLIQAIEHRFCDRKSELISLLYK